MVSGTANATTHPMNTDSENIHGFAGKGRLGRLCDLRLSKRQLNLQ